MTLDAVDQASEQTRSPRGLFDAWARRVLRLDADAEIDAAALDTALEAARAQTLRKKDPFTKLVDGDRTGERIVFENDAFMLLHDRFASGIKLLCVPKNEALFLTDLSTDAQLAIEALVSRTADALKKATDADRVDTWVNPPSGLSVRQLHVHIQPVGGPEAGQDAVYAALAKALETPPSTSENVEVELKFGVHHAADLEAIVEACGGRPLNTVEQSNAFFDDAQGALDKARVAVRIRKETIVQDGARGTPRYELTLKGPHRADGELTVKAEEEWDLSEQGARAALDAGCCPLTLVKGEPPRKGGESILIPKIFALSPGASLHLVGTFGNVRKKAAATLAGHDVTLELDATTFPSGRTDYELEVEAPDDAAAQAVRDALTKIFAAAGIVTFAQSSKAGRFFSEVRAGVAGGAKP